MKENVSGCFFLNTVYNALLYTDKPIALMTRNDKRRD